MISEFSSIKKEEKESETLYTSAQKRMYPLSGERGKNLNFNFKVE